MKRARVDRRRGHFAIVPMSTQHPELAVRDVLNSPPCPVPPPAHRPLVYARAPNLHLVQLLVHLAIVLIVLDELHDERAVREREQLAVDLVCALPCVVLCVSEARSAERASSDRVMGGEV